MAPGTPFRGTCAAAFVVEKAIARILRVRIRRGVISAPESELLYPLPMLYAAARRELPRFEAVKPGDLPPVARRLLVHSGDMTSKLEEHFGDAMQLRVLQCDHTDEHYRREVVLCCAKTGLAVEYGAIEIQLSAFGPAIRDEIIAAKFPLGGLLNRHGIRYRSEPRGFFKIEPCPLLEEVFSSTDGQPLYGRANRLVGNDGAILARIAEILRPV